MTIYKNIHFTKRDYEATNLVACTLEPDAWNSDPKPPAGKDEEVAA